MLLKIGLQNEIEKKDIFSKRMLIFPILTGNINVKDQANTKSFFPYTGKHFLIIVTLSQKKGWCHSIMLILDSGQRFYIHPIGAKIIHHFLNG